MFRLILFIAAIQIALATAAFAQVNVVPVELASGFETVNGELVLAGPQAVFLSRAEMGRSFHFGRGDVDDLTDENGAIVVRLRQPIKTGQADRTQLYFRYNSPTDARAIASWYRAPAGAGETASRQAPGADTSRAIMQFDVRHERFLGDTNGMLIVTSDTIRYESTDKIEDSRNWSMREIKEIKRDNPYDLEVKPFAGNDYDFVVKGTPISGEDFSKLQNLVVSARTSSP